jgi:hypothetical protein
MWSCCRHVGDFSPGFAAISGLNCFISQGELSSPCISLCTSDFLLRIFF